MTTPDHHSATNPWSPTGAAATVAASALRSFPTPRFAPSLSPSTSRAADRSEPVSALRGLVFDMGDVLYDATVWRRWLLKLLGRFGVRTGYREFFSVWDREYLVDVHCGRRTYADALRAFLLAQGLTPGQATEVEIASNVQQRELEAATRAFPGIASTLEYLKRDYVLGVLSDSEQTGAALERRLAALGLAGRFTAVVSSIDLGRVKPAAECYHAVLEALAVSANQAAFIGHDDEELSGAAAVGMTTIAFNHEAAVRADVYLDRFALLPELLARRTASAASGQA